jgi:hypothetical protein
VKGVHFELWRPGPKPRKFAESLDGVIPCEAGSPCNAETTCFADALWRSPVTKRSGKSRIVTRRIACNPRLSKALYHWARVAVQLTPAVGRSTPRLGNAVTVMTVLCDR